MDAQATKFYTVTFNICGFSVWNVHYVTLLAYRILRWLLYFWKICETLGQLSAVVPSSNLHPCPFHTTGMTRSAFRRFCSGVGYQTRLRSDRCPPTIGQCNVSTRLLNCLGAKHTFCHFCESYCAWLAFGKANLSFYQLLIWRNISAFRTTLAVYCGTIYRRFEYDTSCTLWSNYFIGKLSKWARNCSIFYLTRRFIFVSKRNGR
jgi:hypothetical protein